MYYSASTKEHTGVYPSLLGVDGEPIDDPVAQRSYSATLIDSDDPIPDFLCASATGNALILSTRAWETIGSLGIAPHSEYQIELQTESGEKRGPAIVVAFHSILDLMDQPQRQEFVNSFDLDARPVVFSDRLPPFDLFRAGMFVGVRDSLVRSVTADNLSNFKFVELELI